MLRSLVRLALVGCLAILSPTAADAEPTADSTRQESWAAVDVFADLPEDLVEPRGKTRWDLTSVTLGPSTVRTLTGDPADPRRTVERRSRHAGIADDEIVYTDTFGGEAVKRWLQPDRDPDLLSLGGVEPIVIEQMREQKSRGLWIRARRVGVGWVFLPSGPREVVLQEALVLHRADGAAGYEPASLIHRWVDPRAGVVAEVAGPVSPDGRVRTAIHTASVLESTTRGLTPTRIYFDQANRPVDKVVRYGWNRGAGTTIASLTPDGHATIGDLAAASSWDFSANNPTNYPGMQEVASTNTEVAANRTENYGRCGISEINGRTMGREDGDFLDPANAEITLSVTEPEGGATSAGTLWLRGAIENEGVPGLSLDSEAELCHDGGGRTPVPLWRFTHEDTSGDWYFTPPDDNWANTPLNCEQTITLRGLITLSLYTKWCDNSSIGNLSGEQKSEVLKSGPVTLPSGHTFDALLIRQTVEYCVYLGAGCTSSFSDVRTVLHLFEVPWLGTVVRLQSVNNAPDKTSFTDLLKTDIKYGLLPPRAINVNGSTATSVDLSWDPGLVTSHIDGYKVYWNTMSGADASYAFNSVDDPGQATIVGTTATITGLATGVPHYFTVTSLSNHCDVGLCRNGGATCTVGNDPICPAPVVYESLVFPTQLSGGAAPVPAEVSVTPGGGCTPTSEVTGLTVNPSGTDVELCWDPTADVCATGYQILGADTPESSANFSVLVNDTGLTTCATLDPSQKYFQVLVNGSGGTGPWGHYGL